MKIVIVGDGKIGSTLAEQLSREGHEITIIDRSGEPLQQTSEDLDILCIEGNGATYATQMEAGVDAADLLIAVTMSDELNLLCCLVAKKIGARRKRYMPSGSGSCRLLRARLSAHHAS